MYLPPYDCVTIFHLRDLAARKRTWLKCDGVKILQVPQFEGLKVEVLLQYAEQFPEVRKALPEVQREIAKMPRAYICNIIYTFAGEPFAEFVNGKVRARNQKIQQEQDYIQMDPEIAAIYQRSTAVSGK